MSEKNPVVVEDFLDYLKDADVAVAVAVIKALTGVIQRSQASTMMQMESELQEAAAQLKTIQTATQCSSMENGSNQSTKKQHPTHYTRYQSSIATTAGCQLFLRYVTRTFLEFDVSYIY
jgi:translation initiation factor eIF-2B subunit alpha